MDGSRPRSLVEDGLFDAQRRRVIPDTEAWDEIRAGFDLTICRKSDIGRPIKHNSTVRTVRTMPAPGWGAPPLRIYYRYDVEYVHLLWVEPVSNGHA